MLLSILQTGNGLSAESAYKVLSVTEQYSLMSFFDLQTEMQSLQNIKGHSFDVHECTKRLTVGKLTVYFEIDWFYKGNTSGETSIESFHSKKFQSLLNDVIQRLKIDLK